MSLTPMMIAPFKTGLDTDLEAWLAPPDAFSEINNIYLHHGYLQKREGFRTFGDLIPIGATVAMIVLPTVAVTQANPGVVTTNVAHLYTTGDKVFIAGVAGMTEINNKIFTITVINATSFSIDLNTTDLTACTGPGTSALINNATDRVMGITRYIEADETKTTIAFNARRAYRFNGVSNIFVQLDGVDIFSSDEYDFVWASNWQAGSGTTLSNRLYFTNGKAGTPKGAATKDGIRYYNGTVDDTITVEFNPTLSTDPLAADRRTLDGGKLIFSLGQRLIVLYTYEYAHDTTTTTTYPQRARWCAKQNPGNWNDVTAGGGGYTDAATGDQIISARQIQNQIIVFFTNSVWSLVPTGDPNRAFKWQKINSFRACDGKMASIGYDKYSKALGVRGVTATDGVETRRIDDRIEAFTTDTINVGEFNKVFCERSYANKRWWTLFNTLETTDNENDSALIFDDDSESFTTYSIAMNCLGYGNFTQDYGLDDFTVANDKDLELKDFSDEDFFSYFWQEDQEAFLGGNIDGEIFVMETDGDDNSLSITSDFETVAWNPFKDSNSECQMNYIDFYVDTHISTTATISFYKDAEFSPYASKQMDFLPNLDYVASIVAATASNPVNINAPEHGLTTDDIIYIYGATGMTSINSGQAGDAYTITVVDDNNFTLNGINGTSFNAYTGSGKVYLKKFYQTSVWKRVFAGGVGFQHRIRFNSSGTDKPFRIHGIQPSFKKRGKRLIN